MRTTTISCVLAVILGGSAPAFAGYYLEHEAVLPHPQSRQNIRVTLRSWLQDGKLKRRTPLQDVTIIVDLSKQNVVGFDEHKRTCWTMSAARYRDYASSSLLVFGIAPTPAGGVTVPPTLFEATGQEAEVAGRKAKELRVRGSFPAGMQTHIWVSRDVPLSPEMWVQQMKLVLGAPEHPSYQNLFRQFSALPGYPVQTVTTVETGQGTAMSSETLVALREENIPAGAFEVPADCRHVPDPISEMERQRNRSPNPVPLGIDAPL